MKPQFGLFGGAFDPPHTGHVALAQAAIRQCNLSRLFVVPTGQAWHKARTLTLASDRLAMTRLAFTGVPEVIVDEREINRSGPTYTIDTLQALRAAHPAADWVLLLGADQWAAFTSWHRWQELRQLATILIAARAGVSCSKAIFDAQNEAFLPIVSLDLPLQPTSSTEVRLQVAQTGSHSPNALVSEAVASYISRHQLYLSQTLPTDLIEPPTA